MKPFVLLLLAALAGCSPLTITVIDPPDYDSDRGIGWAASRDAYAAARADDRYVLEQFT